MLVFFLRTIGELAFLSSMERKAIIEYFHAISRITTLDLVEFHLLVFYYTLSVKMKSRREKRIEKL
jgi:hypothetical protein